MHKKDAMPGAMGQQPASTPAAPHAPAAHPTDPKSPASQNAPATPDAMAPHMAEMAVMLREQGQALSALGRQMQAGSLQQDGTASLTEQVCLYGSIQGASV